jgi:hypothetical protein
MIIEYLCVERPNDSNTTESLYSESRRSLWAREVVGIMVMQALLLIDDDRD